MRKADASNLDRVVMAELDAYANALPDDIMDAQKTAAKAAVKDLKNTSPSETGKYAKSWKTKSTKTRTGAETVIYNAMPGLPHLLEHGHDVKVNGRKVGHAKAYPHIKDAEEKAMQLFEKELERRIGGS